MRSKLVACLVVFVVSSPCLHAASMTDPCQVLQGLRAQMKLLKTIKAEYTVDSVYGPSRRPMKSRVLYVRDGERFNIVENQTDPNGRQRLDRTVYNGIEIKLYRHVQDERGQAQGVILPASRRNQTFADDDLLEDGGFSLIRPGNDERYARFPYEYRGTEAIDDHDCLKIVFIAPYLPGQKAFSHFWIETSGSQYVLRKDVCLIDDKPEQLLYERQYGYDSSAGYPFPTRIAYQRYDINRQGQRSLAYDKQFRVQRIQINGPIDPCEFSFTFPKGTVVNVSVPTPSPAELVNPRPSVSPERKPPFDPNQTQPDPRTEFEFERGQAPLFLPVRFGGEVHDFMLDTGTTYTAFDLSLRSQLGEPKGMTGGASGAAQDRIVMQVFASPRAFVGPFSIGDCNEVICANLKGLGPVLGRDVHGILGFNFLSRHIVQIDFDAGRIAFLDGKPDPGRDWGQEFTMSYSPGRVPQIKAALAGQPEVDFVVDTGYGGSGGLAKDLFGLILAKGDLKPRETPVATLTGVSQTREVRADRLVVGPFEYRGLIFGEGNMNILGLDFLSRHIVTFDFPHNRLYLKKGKGFDGPDESGMAGVSLVRSDGRTVVYAVYEGCPAAKAGIKAGDVIFKLQGRDASTYPIWEIRDLFRSGDGKEITMTIQRGSDTIDLSLRLERAI